MSENENIPNNQLSIPDVMRELNCSRHMVMKYYSEEGLPLVKKGNRYYIEEYDFFKWKADRIARKEKEQRMVIIFSLLTIVAILIIVVIAYFFDK